MNRFFPGRLYFLLLLLAGCREASITYPEGGFPFPEKVAGKDTAFYFYPLRDSVEPYLVIRNSDSRMLQALGEENLSIRPAAAPVFRLTYEVLGMPTVIRLTKDRIIIKKWVSGDYMPAYDTARLKGIEKEHYGILLRYHQPQGPPSRRRWADSVVKSSARLSDPAYFASLVSRVEVPPSETVRFTTKEVRITEAQFEKVVKEINASGYWQSPYFKECPSTATHSPGMTLEANTTRHYKMVAVQECDDRSSSRITRAWQELVNLAGMGRELQLSGRD